MESFFFNLDGYGYRISTLVDRESERIDRVDISNGIVFLDIAMTLRQPRTFTIDNLDRMLIFPVVFRGGFTIEGRSDALRCKVAEQRIPLFVSSRQDFTIGVPAGEHRFFILFVADFILKRYLVPENSGIVDHLYRLLQEEHVCHPVDEQPLDALSVHLIGKITDIRNESTLRGIRCEARILEWMIHRLGLIDFSVASPDEESLRIARRAREILLAEFVSPPGIAALAHRCATNESKLKQVFKTAYGTTVYNYVRKLRMEKANLLLRECSMNIGAIARAVGYSHQGHFSRLFFRHYGVYPKVLLRHPPV